MKKITLGILLILIALMLVPMLKMPMVYAAEGSETTPAGHVPTPVDEVWAPSDKLVVQDVIPWAPGAGGVDDPKYQASVDLGFTTRRVHSDTFADPGFALIDADGAPMWKAIIFVSDQPQTYYDNLALAAAKVAAYVAQGGVLIGNVCDKGWHFGDWTGLNILPGGVSKVYMVIQNLHIVDPLNIFTGMTDAQISGWNFAAHGYFTNLVAGTTVLVEVAGEPTQPVYIEYPWGQGLVKATMMTLEWAAQGHAGAAGIPTGYTIIKNEIIEAQHFGVPEFAVPVFAVTSSLFAAMGVFLRRKRRLVTT